MEKKTVMKSFAVIALSIVIAVSMANIILLGPLYLVSFDKSFYYREFEKYDIYKDMEHDKKIVDENFSDVIDYIAEKDVVLDRKFYNEKEIRHLADVRDLFRFARYMLLACTALLVAAIAMLMYLGERIEAIKAVMLGSFLCIAVMMFTAISALIDFRSTFIAFHHLLFTNDLWILNPATDNLINMMPSGLFFDLALRWLGIVALVCIALIACMMLLRRRCIDNP